MNYYSLSKESKQELKDRFPLFVNDQIIEESLNLFSLLDTSDISTLGQSDLKDKDEEKTKNTAQVFRQFIEEK